MPEATAAYQILAMNTEKAHNLREKSLEVIRMYKELARLDDATEETYALEFEEPAFITLGLCYEERPRFSGGAYHSVLKRVDDFLKKPMRAAIELRQERAKTILALDDQIVQQVEALKAKGLTSPYLKSFVVARVNPIRFRSKDAPPPDFEETFDKMMKAASKFDANKIKVEDLAKSGAHASLDSLKRPGYTAADLRAASQPIRGHFTWVPPWLANSRNMPSFLFCSLCLCLFGPIQTWITKIVEIASKVPGQSRCPAMTSNSFPCPSSGLANFGKTHTRRIYDERLAPVESYEAGNSPYGLHHMAGNVYEWTADWYDEDFYAKSPQRNPTGPSNGQYRILRGGSWLFKPIDVRSAHRSYTTPTNQYDYIGFRCAQDSQK